MPKDLTPPQSLSMSTSEFISELYNRKVQGIRDVWDTVKVSPLAQGIRDIRPKEGLQNIWTVLKETPVVKKMEEFQPDEFIKTSSQFVKQV